MIAVHVRDEDVGDARGIDPRFRERGRKLPGRRPEVRCRTRVEQHHTIRCFHQQWVKTVSLDCDGDVVLVKVDQVGAACHTGDRTCWDADDLGATVGAPPA